MKIPPHKVVSDVGKPGQIVNRPTPTASFDRYPYLKHSTADQTLADYLTRKKRYEALDTLQPLTEAPKKLTFEEWMNSKFEGVFGYDNTRPKDFILWGMPGYLVYEVWKAAQENV